MAEHDYVIANGTGSAVRGDINDALEAIVSNNSKATEPSTTYAYQWWADTGNGLLKLRNAANSAWVTVGTLASANLGLVPASLFDANSILAATSDDTPAALTVAASRIVGRKASGGVAALTAAELRGLMGSELLQSIEIACGDETTALTTGTAKVTFRMPFAFTLTAVRASLTTASSSAASPVELVTVDINEAGTTILSTKLTIDDGEKTSTTAATPAVISDANLADDAEITIDVDVAGTGAKGLKVYLIGYRPAS